MSTQPAIFVSHGSPMIAVEPGPGHDFLASLAGEVARPKAILAVTAHWLTRAPAFSLDGEPETIHDFGGFPDALYQLRYPAPGAPDLAQRALDALSNAGIGAAGVKRRGFDHGTWVPLMLAYPEADIPVLQMSVQPERDAAWHYRLGRALRPLRDDGVLILGSGGMTHNLQAIFQRRNDTPPDWVNEFLVWARQAIAENRTEELLNYLDAAPHAAMNHPSPEHFLPLFVALGAGTPEVPGRPLYQAVELGVLSMDAYRFD